MEEIYIDQAFRQTWPISTFLTPLGFVGLIQDSCTELSPLVRGENASSMPTATARASQFNR